LNLNAGLEFKFARKSLNKIVMSHLKAGDKAPLFSGIDQSGNRVELASFKGYKVVLYFYPKDNTPGCTAEACSLRDNYDRMLSHGYKVVGVSPDSEASHRKFADKFELPFPLIADTEKKILNDYGVWGRKKFMGREYDGVIRTTFIIDDQGVIEEIIEKVDTKNHASQVLKD
jgi:peroxiredoxin Q/BCP